MLRVLRLTRVNHRTIPQTHRLVACALTPRARSAHEFIIKKITHPYPFRFILPCRSALWLPCPGRGRALPSLVLRAPSVAARSHPVVCTARSLLSLHWCRWCSRRPPDRPKPGAGGGGARC
jgi:hypothetical protein